MAKSHDSGGKEVIQINLNHKNFEFGENKCIDEITEDEESNEPMNLK